MKKQLQNSIASKLPILSVIVFGVAGYYFETGLPPILMMAIGAIIGFLINVILNFIFRFLGRWVNKVPLNIIAAIASTLVVLIIAPLFGFRWPNQIYIPAIILAVVFYFILAYCLKKINSKNGLSKILAWSGILSTAVFIIGGVYWLWQSGSDPYSEKLPKPFSENILALSSNGIKNPAENGNYKIIKFTYGSGTDKKRKEYAADVKYKTSTVDASQILPEWKKWKKKWRENYWGFGVKNFPLNGRVYMPEGDGPFPLVLIVHGNHSMIDYSDDGYGYLGELLASRGFIAVSVDENFINAHWSGDFRGKEMAARAWLLLKHLEQWEKWNNSLSHDLANKIDMENILLIGHSRGGEAVSIAAAFNKLKYFPDNAMERFNFNFGIKGIVSIAPTDYRYHREINLENINYLSLQGSYDFDEISFWGMRPFRRLKFTDGGDWFKAGVYIHRANHGQFNSTWGEADFGGTFKWLLNTAPLISDDDQQKVAQVFISAFAEAALKNNNGYLPLFKNAALGKDWLPENYYLNHFQKGNIKTVADFEKDMELSSEPGDVSIKTNNLKIWREEKLKTRDNGSQENNAVILGWDYGEKIKEDSLAIYSIILPDSFSVEIDSTGEFLISIAAGDFKELDKGQKKAKKKKTKKREEPQLDFTLSFTDKNGQTAKLPISQMKNIVPMLKSKFTKMKSIDKYIVGNEWEVHLDGFHIPIEAFNKANPAFDIKFLQKIELIFDQCNYGLLVVDDIGFASP